MYGKAHFLAKFPTFSVLIFHYEKAIDTPIDCRNYMSSKCPNHSTCQWLEIKPGLWLDGSSQNNPARHANHSCAPNAELVYSETNEEACLIATTSITPGDEITFDYGFSLADGLFHSCHCEQPSCAGHIVAAPLRPALRRHLRFSRPRD